MAKESQTKENLERQEKFLEEINRYRPEDILVLDESGFLLSQRRDYGWSKKGERLREQRKRRSERLSLIGVISQEDVVGMMTLNGSFNTKSFLRFLELFVLPFTRPGQVLVMDNWTVHKTEKLEPLLMSYGVKPLFLPPYSPEFSPIELFWGWLKNHLKSWAGSTREAVESGIRNALEILPSTHCSGWFRRCGYPD